MRAFLVCPWAFALSDNICCKFSGALTVIILAIKSSPFDIGDITMIISFIFSDVNMKIDFCFKMMYSEITKMSRRF